MREPAPIERRLRISGMLLALGLLIELATLRWSHPTAFLVFLFGGGALMALGVLVYLFALVSRDVTREPRP